MWSISKHGNQIIWAIELPTYLGYLPRYEFLWNSLGFPAKKNEVDRRDQRSTFGISELFGSSNKVRYLSCFRRIILSNSFQLAHTFKYVNCLANKHCNNIPWSALEQWSDKKTCSSKIVQEKTQWTSSCSWLAKSQIALVPSLLTQRVQR